jgi:predicted DCC family thiol-disulfide oxidoreductase YuxK
MAADSSVRIVYDGACPFCANYARLQALREEAGSLELFDARTLGESSLCPPGVDLNDGMIVWVGDEFHHGADALHVLAQLSARRSFFSRITARLFGVRKRAALAYPIMRSGRAIVLRVLGVRPL